LSNTKHNNTTTHTMPPSPLRALLWKEWRQQRGIFLGMAWVGPVMIWASRWSKDFDLALVLGGFFASYGLILLLGTNAFNLESDQRTSRFIMAQPIGRRRLFMAKGMVAILLTLIAQTGVIALMLWQYNGDNYSIFMTMFAGSIMVLFVPALVTQWTTSSIACAFASLCASLPLACSMVFGAGWFSQWESVCLGGIFNGPMAATISVCLCGLIPIMVFIFCTWRPSRKGSMWWGMSKTISIVFLTMLTTTLPLAAEWFWNAKVMTPSDWAKVPRCSMYPVQASEDGNHLLLEVTDGRRIAGSGMLRGICVDTRTGEAVWATKGSMSATWAREIPRHNMALVSESDLSPAVAFMADILRGPLKNITIPSLQALLPQRDWLSRIIPMTIPGKAIHLPEVSQEWGWSYTQLGWWDKDELALKTDKGILFLNVRSDGLRICRTPESVVSRLDVESGSVVQRSGLLALADVQTPDGTELRFLRYHPNLDIAEVLDTELDEWVKSHIPQYGKSKYTQEHRWTSFEISRDRKWAYVSYIPIDNRSSKISTSPHHSLLISLATGELLHLKTRGPEPRNGLIGQGWRVARWPFMARGPLCVNGNKLAVFDLKTRRLEILAQVTESKHIYPLSISPSGRRAIISGRNDTERTWHVWDSKTRKLYPITSNDAYEGYPRHWIDDERILIIIQHKGRGLHIANWDGTGLRPLIKTTD
jgi:ABC-2 family transporter protein